MKLAKLPFHLVLKLLSFNVLSCREEQCLRSLPRDCLGQETPVNIWKQWHYKYVIFITSWASQVALVVKSPSCSSLFWNFSKTLCTHILLEQTKPLQFLLPVFKLACLVPVNVFWIILFVLFLLPRGLWFHMCLVLWLISTCSCFSNQEDENFSFNCVELFSSSFFFFFAIYLIQIGNGQTDRYCVFFF